MVQIGTVDVMCKSVYIEAGVLVQNFLISSSLPIFPSRTRSIRLQTKNTFFHSLFNTFAQQQKSYLIMRFSTGLLLAAASSVMGQRFTNSSIPATESATTTSEVAPTGSAEAAQPVDLGGATLGPGASF